MRYCTILLLIFMPLVLLNASAQAQSTGWAPPLEVSPAYDSTANAQEAAPTQRVYPSSWFPDMAVGPEGSVHIIWNSGIATSKDPKDAIDLLLYRELRDGKWSPVNEIAVPGTGGYTVRNSITMSRDGRLHVLMRSKVDEVYTSALWDRAWSARSWSTPLQISGGGASYYNELAADDHGVLHALWSEAMPDDPQQPNKECAFCSDMFYRRSDDGGKIWSLPINLSRSPDGENRPQIKVDRQGRIHVAWDEGADWYAGKGIPRVGVYRMSADGGTSWSGPTLFKLPDSAVQQTTLGITADGNPLVVYRSVGGDKLFLQSSSDGGSTWGAAAEIPGVRTRNIGDNNLDRYSLATDGAGNIHLLMVGFTGEMAGNPRLLHLVWDGRNWSTPTAVMDNGLYPEWPKIVISGGNELHAVWFTRNKEDLFGSDKGAHYRIWYSSSNIPVPATSLPPLFTAVPVAIPTAPLLAVLPLAQPTPLAKPILQAPAISGSPTWEASGLAVIGLALAIVVGPLSVLVALMSRKSRH